MPETNVSVQRQSILLKKAPAVEVMAPRWDVFRRLYDGGEAVRTLLRQYSREHEDDFRKRRERAFYLNYCRPIIDTYGAFIFNKVPERTVDKIGKDLRDDVQAFHANVDAKGTSIDTFMHHHVLYEMNLYGQSFVVVDMPDAQDVVLNEAQRKSLGLRPYVYTVPPLRVINYQLDRSGQLLWIRWEEDPEPIEDPFSPDLLTVQDSTKRPRRIRTWTRTRWYVHQVTNDAEAEIASGGNPLGEVPIVLVKALESSEYPPFGLSAINDIAYIALALFQWSSLLDENFHDQVLKVLAVHTDMPDQAKEYVISAHNVFEYSGNIPPQFLTAPSAPEQVLLESILAMKAEMFRLARLGGSSNPTSGQSGIAHAFEFNETNQVLAEQAAALEEGEKQVHRLWAKWMNVEWSGAISYPREFGIDLFEDDIRITEQASNAIKSPTFRRRLLERLAKKFLRREDPDVINSVISEIEQLVQTEFAIELQRLLTQASSSQAGEAATTTSSPPEGEAQSGAPSEG